VIITYFHYGDVNTANVIQNHNMHVQRTLLLRFEITDKEKQSGWRSLNNSIQKHMDDGPHHVTGMIVGKGVCDGENNIDISISIDGRGDTLVIDKCAAGLCIANGEFHAGCESGGSPPITEYEMTTEMT